MPVRAFIFIASAIPSIFVLLGLSAPSILSDLSDRLALSRVACLHKG